MTLPIHLRRLRYEILMQISKNPMGNYIVRMMNDDVIRVPNFKENRNSVILSKLMKPKRRNS